jgi:2-amino-4-hydroxy-6-hydroxymethyldihydropteridine diphosphokinase
MAIVYIGIGSNTGNKEENCLNAINLLSARGIPVRRRSSLYETEPWGVKDQPSFVNATVEAETDLTPQELIVALKSIEKEMGRQETYRWGPRAIDLDILLYNDLVIDEPDLTIPHPYLHQREFVLKPLSEIAPDKIHPVLKKTIRTLLAEVA